MPRQTRPMGVTSIRHVPEHSCHVVDFVFASADLRATVPYAGDAPILLRSFDPRFQVLEGAQPLAAALRGWIANAEQSAAKA